MQLPSIERADFLEYLDFQFEATGKPAEEQALDAPPQPDALPPAQHPAARVGDLGEHAGRVSPSRSRR